MEVIGLLSITLISETCWTFLLVKNVTKVNLDLEKEENKPLKIWLEEYPKKKTRYGNQRNFEKFLEWSGKTPKQLVDEFDKVQTKSLVQRYQSYLLNEYPRKNGEKGLSQNSARTYVTSVLAFFSSTCSSLKVRLVDVKLPIGEHQFSTDDLREMFAIADVRDKAILSLACSLGWTASPFLSLEKSFVEKLVQRAKQTNQDFIAFDWQREKTGSAQYGILTPIALHSLERYLEKLNRENPSQKVLFDLTTKGLNHVIKSLAEESGIQTIGSVRFHLIRKWLMQSLVDAGLSSFEVKLVLGKSVSLSDLTYLQVLKNSTLSKYKKAYPMHLSLSQNLNGQAKYNILTDLAVQMFTVMDAFKEEAKNQGLMKMSSQLEEQWKSVKEFAEVMKKKNGKKPEEEAEENENSED
jgi:site-specific recombinase XerD